MKRFNLIAAILCGISCIYYILAFYSNPEYFSQNSEMHVTLFMTAIMGVLFFSMSVLLDDAREQISEKNEIILGLHKRLRDKG